MCLSFLYVYMHNRSDIIYPLSSAFSAFYIRPNLLYQVEILSVLHRCLFHTLNFFFFYHDLTALALLSVSHSSCLHLFY